MLPRSYLLPAIYTPRLIGRGTTWDSTPVLGAHVSQLVKVQCGVSLVSGDVRMVVFSVFCMVSKGYLVMGVTPEPLVLLWNLDSKKHTTSTRYAKCPK